MKTRYLLFSTVCSLLATGAMAQAFQGDGDPNGSYCREYTQKVIVGGVKRDSYGTACQQPDGAWKIMTNSAQEQAPEQQVRYVSKPVYVTEPVYVPTPVYYTQPVYAPYYGYGGPYYGRPYYGGSSVSISVGSGGGWRRGGYYGGYGHHW